jgi:hypothetical protein
MEKDDSHLGEKRERSSFFIYSSFPLKAMKVRLT